MQRPRTGGFEPIGAGAAAQAHQPQAGPVPLFRMWPPFHDLLDQAAGLGAGFLGPTDQPGRCPFRMGPDGRWAYVRTESTVGDRSGGDET